MSQRTQIQSRILDRVTVEDRGYVTPCWVSDRAKQLGRLHQDRHQPQDSAHAPGGVRGVGRRDPRRYAAGSPVQGDGLL